MTPTLESSGLGLPEVQPRHRSFPAILQLAACNFCIATGFYLTLSSAPTYLSRLGGPIAAGSATTVSAFTTAAASLVAPALIARLGRRFVFALAAAALGGPCILLFGPSLALAELACAIRGAGLGLLFVATGGLAAALVSPQRRGELLGLVGLGFSVPATWPSSLRHRFCSGQTRSPHMPWGTVSSMTPDKSAFRSL